MTNRQIKGNAVRPSRRDVSWEIFQTAVATGIYIWMWFAPGIWSGLGVFGWMLVLMHRVEKTAEVCRKRYRALAELKAQRARNTGTWVDVHRGETAFTVRWDPASEDWYVQDAWDKAERCVGEMSARMKVATVEAGGSYAPRQDEGTSAVRVRLGLEQWEEPALGGPRGDLWDEPARDLTEHRKRFYPGPS